MCCIAKIVSFKINNYGYCNNAFLGKDQILVGFDYYGYIDDPLRIVVMVSTGIGIRGVISVVRVAFDSFWNCSYRAQNETYMCRSAENVVKSLCFNKLCAVG